MSKDISISIEKIRSLAKDLPLFELLQRSTGAFSEDATDYALAACVRACEAGLSLTPFDEQLLAAAEMYKGNIIQMSTGEGKTIAAVFAAYLFSLDGRKTHILTFNDYLAERDQKWMLPITERLNLRTGFILENTPRNERRAIYGYDIVYSTAKEVGFDFLRDFTVSDSSDTVLTKLDNAIVDEADSILIDEARIPLVIAGDMEVVYDKRLPDIAKFVAKLSEKDYAISLEHENAFLTDKGTEVAEQHFGIDNIYDEENISLLSSINDCLKAQYLLSEGKDYIVRDGEILLVDGYTGRVATNQHYPGTLHMAVEAKHGLPHSVHGVEMGTIALQFFMRQYESVCGMTGTAADAKEEFELLYGLSLSIIPPHLPSQRIDGEPRVYYSKADKWKAVENEVQKRYSTGQPVLVGTSSIEESEQLAESLTQKGIQHVKVLNAKNDEMEADIIRDAGALHAVTISTNMAGRGVDILLGGKDTATRDEVINAGGLCVIATAMHESARINKQLYGRAGRQGDVGESVTFYSLDEEIMDKFELRKLVGTKHYPSPTTEQITDKVVLREVERIQRISEGDTLDRRKQLLKFTMIGEKHRDATFGSRKRFITGESVASFWEDYARDEYRQAVDKFGKEAVAKLQQDLIISAINEAWSSYLEYTSDLRRGIHLTEVGGKSPAEEYNISAEQYFESMEDSIREIMLEYLDKLLEVDEITELQINKPSKTWTYLLTESVGELAKQPLLLNAFTEHIIDGDEEDIEQEPPKADKDKKKGGFLKSLFGGKS